MIQLPNVTLLCVATRDVEASAKALEYSCSGIDFAAVKLISPYRPYNMIESYLWEHVPSFVDIDGWNHYIFYNLWRHFDTEYVMLVHSDGFIVNPQSWREAFLDYDYIGAIWPIVPPFYTNYVTGETVRVGNSVSIRSKKLCKIPHEVGIPWQKFDITPTYPGNYNEDTMICIHQRHIFQQHGILYAPVELAAHFCIETELPENAHVTEPFCFHKWNGRNSQYPRF